MGIIKCFDAAAMVIEDATERFKPSMSLNTKKLDVFKQYCDIIDDLAEEFEGESFEVEVDEITMEVTVALECGEVIIESSDHMFYELIKRTNRYIFTQSEEGNLVIKFVFPPLWGKA